MNGFKKHQPINDADYVFTATIANTLAVTTGDMLTLATVGTLTWTAASSSTEYWQMKAIALEDTATTATKVRCLLLREGVSYEAVTTNNTSSDANGDRMTLTSAGAVNNPTTAADVTTHAMVCIQLTPLGAAAEKRILVLIPGGDGVNPDAS